MSVELKEVIDQVRVAHEMLRKGESFSALGYALFHAADEVLEGTIKVLEALASLDEKYSRAR